MKKVIVLLLFIFLNPANAHQTTPCDNWPSRLQSMCRHFHQLWTEGDNELYLSGYAWHNRYTYTREKIKTYNELAWGGGLGKGRYDEKGNWHGIFAFAFRDSHSHMEPTAGYAFLNIAHLNNDLRFGLGYAILVTSRADILNGIPFPGILPWVSLIYRKVTLSATYIPGAKRAGNVLYVIGKLNFDLF